MTASSDDIINRAVESAYQKVPDPPRWSVKLKCAVAAVLLVIIANSTLSIYDTHQLSQQQACSISQNKVARQIASDDRTVVDVMVNEIINASSQAKVEAALTDYTASRKADDTKRSKLYSQHC